jgi:hypothetical protein
MLLMLSMLFRNDGNPLADANQALLASKSFDFHAYLYIIR